MQLGTTIARAFAELRNRAVVVALTARRPAVMLGPPQRLQRGTTLSSLGTGRPKKVKWQNEQSQSEQAPKQHEASKCEVATMIAKTLGETDEGARKRILSIVRATGRTHARELLSMTLQTEENGGILVPDGTRRRTPGGVFFHLACTRGRTKSGHPLERPVKPTKKPENGTVQSSQANDTPKAQPGVQEPVQPQPAILLT
jgi:hypothetical protein